MMSDMHLALHGLAIKKHGDAAGVAEIMGADEAEIRAALEKGAELGRLSKAGGKYMLTPAAQMAMKMEYPLVYAEQRESVAMNDAYEAFEKINAELKQLVTEWQTMEIGGDKVPNDHSNKDYDDKIIDRLGALHERFEPVLRRLSAELPRLDVYKGLLLNALEKAEDGEIEWVSDAKIASYHTVWFEMHEDLLRVLGRERDE